MLAVYESLCGIVKICKSRGSYAVSLRAYHQLIMQQYTDSAPIQQRFCQAVFEWYAVSAASATGHSLWNKLILLQSLQCRSAVIVRKKRFPHWLLNYIFHGQVKSFMFP